MSTQNPVDQADGATSTPQATVQERLQRAIHRYGALQFDLDITFPARRYAVQNEQNGVRDEIEALLAEINRGAK